MNRLTAIVLAASAVAAVQGTPDARSKVIGRTHAIDAAAAEVSRITRSLRIEDQVAIILAESAGIREDIGAPTGPPPPPSTSGPWVTPDDDTVGAHAPFASVEVSSHGWNMVTGLPPTVADMDLGSMGSTATHTMYHDGMRPLAYSNVRMHGFPGVVSQWITRAYDAFDWRFEDCTWDTCSNEHGFYVNAIGKLFFVNCSFENIKGQGVQLVWSVPDGKRDRETALDPDAWRRAVMAVKDVPIMFERCLFLDCALYGEQSSYALSVTGETFTPGVSISRSYFDTNQLWTDNNGIQRNCHGAISVTNARGFRLTDSFVGYTNGDRDSVQVWFCSDGRPGTEDVVIQGCTFMAGKAIDLRVRSGDTVVIEGNTGSTPVTISMNPTWVVDGKQYWDESLVLFRGQINQDWRQN